MRIQRSQRATGPRYSRLLKPHSVQKRALFWRKKLLLSLGRNRWSWQMTCPCHSVVTVVTRGRKRRWPGSTDFSGATDSSSGATDSRSAGRNTHPHHPTRSPPAAGVGARLSLGAAPRACLLPRRTRGGTARVIMRALAAVSSPQVCALQRCRAPPAGQQDLSGVSRCCTR